MNMTAREILFYNPERHFHGTSEETKFSYEDGEKSKTAETVYLDEKELEQKVIEANKRLASLN
ncbi:MAG: hypothetical protein K6G00_09520 [Treponema sp.]|nr:hypothetical protein [Treponema sp.]